MACVVNSARRLCLNSSAIQKSAIFPSTLFKRQISTTSCLNIREIKETEDGDTLTVEANLLESERTGKLTCIDKPDKGCTLCGFNVKYTDVLIISQFVDKNGQILPRWVSGLCGYQQTLMNQNLHKAQRAGLMPNLRPPRKDGKKRTSNMSTYAWKKYNVYYEDWDKIPVA
ncbi:28S ribosomal protein S18a, mitochondrial-like [Mizuhopecten yessoensis]|uniref:28S ribosomal protein S18a, mitochondrial n=1 Tax=Mizuhopecten yessoensis TaxID=6573 RepID=A0A210R291_MIZYE|nr:28S ribosomal protein S18a, mitochondrial-like [Mizuhopecten yessoensis]OWF55203.1 28S ribosomal protein S18a, mitochondrial [Mizuhopecten yessoensis]